MHGRVIPESVLYDGSGEPYLADFALEPVDPDPRGGDDVRDFAALVAPLPRPERKARVGEILALGMATVGRPTMTEFVAMLVAALAGAEPAVEDGARQSLQGAASVRRGRRRRLLRS